jgi:hypothetical protein
MKLLASFRSRASLLFHRSPIDDDVDEELRLHIRSRADDLERSGLPRVEAERRARLEFGGYQKFKEECREALGTCLLETLLQDVRLWRAHAAQIARFHDRRHSHPGARHGRKYRHFQLRRRGDAAFAAGARPRALGGVQLDRA